jgi:hypothetical protein
MALMHRFLLPLNMNFYSMADAISLMSDYIEYYDSAKHETETTHKEVDDSIDVAAKQVRQFTPNERNELNYIAFNNLIVFHLTEITGHTLTDKEAQMLNIHRDHATIASDIEAAFKAADPVGPVKKLLDNIRKQKLPDGRTIKDAINDLFEEEEEEEHEDEDEDEDEEEEESKKPGGGVIATEPSDARTRGRRGLAIRRQRTVAAVRQRVGRVNKRTTRVHPKIARVFQVAESQSQRSFIDLPLRCGVMRRR